MKRVDHYLVGRDPARIADPGTHPHPFIPGAQITYGHDAVLDAVTWLVRERNLGADIETVGLHKAGWYLKCVQVGTADHAVLFDPRDPAQYVAIQEVLNSGVNLAFHRSVFDIPGLFLNGLLSEETVLTKIWDTLIYARMAEPDEKVTRSLAACSARYLGFSGEDLITKRAKNLGVTKNKYFEVADLDRPAYLWDAATDAIATARLWPVVRRAAHERQVRHPFGKWGLTEDEAWDLVERPQKRNRRMLLRSCRGFNWDPEYLDKYRMAGAKERAATEAELAQYSIRPGNSQDLIKFLDSQGLVPDDYPRTDTGLMSGAKGNVEKLAHPLVDKFLQLKQADHVDKDYLAKITERSDHNGRIHPEFNILGASATGRDSITEIPLHQFNGPARQIILEDFPGAGVVSIDWTQQEPVLAANMARDAHVLELYENEALPAVERDMYEIVGRFGNIERKPAKETILAQMYGQGMLALALKLGLITPAETVAMQNLCRRIHPDRAHLPKPPTGRDPRTWKPWEAADKLNVRGYLEAMRIKDKVWEVLPRTGAMIKNIKKMADTRRMVFTWSGRILPVPSSYRFDEWSVMVHKGPNLVIQGGAADMLDDAMYRIEEAGLGDAVMFGMHDEIVAQREAAHDIAKIMQQAPERLSWFSRRESKFRTDIADLGDRWGKPE